MSDFELRVDGVAYAGWTSLRVTRSIEELASSFSVSLTDLWRDGVKPVPIEAGDSCVIAIDDEVVLTGYVDSDTGRYDSRRRSLSFAGRSKTGDLVDCAAVYKKGQWRNRSLLKIAKNLCDPYDIDVTASVNLGAALRRFSIQDTETVFNCLERAARERGVFMLTGEDGNLVFDRASTTRIDTVLKYGENILRGEMTNDWQDRFSTYTVKTQAAGDDTMFGKAAASIKRSAADHGINRYRPTTIMAENEDTGKELQKRANWERNTRAGRGKRVSYTVQGWRHSTGLWRPNLLVRVIDTPHRIDDELLVVSATQTRNDSGTLTALELTLKEAFDVQPLPPAKKPQDTSFWGTIKRVATETVSAAEEILE